MLTVDQALAELVAQAKPLTAQKTALEQSLGRVLREDLRADRPIPPFDRVTMDGFAVQSADFAGASPALKIIGELAAGAEPVLEVKKGQAIRIMTGAVLPPGADAVIQIEQCEVAGKLVQFKTKGVKPGLNVAQQGEDAMPGKTLLAAGCFITPSLLAFAASIGKSELSTSPDLKLAVLSTGDELVGVTVTPKPWQIRDANGPALIGMAKELGLQPTFLGICPDDEAQLKEKIAKGLEGDVLLLSGGVSMGDYDLAPKIFKELGIKEVFHKVWMKPGKPVWYGRAESGTHVFGLVGNPVGAQVGFKLFVEPLIYKLLGHSEPLPTYIKPPLLKDVKKKTDRESFIPARFATSQGQSGLEEVWIAGSGDFSNLVKSEGLLRLPADAKGAQAGEGVLFTFWRRR